MIQVKEVAPSSLQSTGPSTTQVVPLQVYTENLGITWERGDLETAAHIANPLKWAELGAPHEVGSTLHEPPTQARAHWGGPSRYNPQFPSMASDPIIQLLILKKSGGLR